MGNLRPHSSENNVKAQSGIEYFLTYGWGMLIIFIVVSLLYLFITSPPSITPSTCAFSASAYCQDLILSSNTAASTIGLFLTNMQPYPIIAPQIKVNFSSGQVTGTCRPYYVLPGGDIICNVTSLSPIPQGTLTSGMIFLSSLPCQSGNVIDCQQNSPRQTYLGNFNAHVSPMISSNSISISLAVLNRTQSVNFGYDKMTATVKLYGVPIPGATVNFTSNSLSASINPANATTNGAGNAMSLISNPSVGNVLVTASFANTIATNTITFIQSVGVAFQLSPQTISTLCTPQNGALAVLTLDSVSYTCSQLPITQPYQAGTQHTYSFIASGVGYLGLSYLFNSISGCGTSGSSGTLTVPSSNCTVTASYAAAPSVPACPSSNPAYTAFGSLNPASQNSQTGPGNTLATDGAFGYLMTADPDACNNEGANWTWDFGSTRVGTFNALWYSTDEGTSGDCGCSYTNFTSTWYASADGTTWTQFAQYQYRGTATAWGAYGSSASPILSQIAGSYRYIRVKQYSDRPSEVCSNAYTYVDSVCINEP